jgi:small-conductance mechanosensitive channel
LGATTLAAPTPFAVKQLLAAVALLPMIVLARPVVTPTLVPALYTVGALFGLDTLRHAFGGIPPLVDQAIVLLESLAGAILMAWLLVRDRARRAPGAAADSAPRIAPRLLIALVLAGLLVGLLASVFGYLRLARLTTPAILVGAAEALWLYAVVEVGTAVIAYVLRVWPMRYTRMIRHHRLLIEVRAHRVLVWMAVVAWTARYLSYLGLWEPTVAVSGELLTTRIALGSIGTSAADLLAFVLTLWLAYLLSAFVRFVLEEEVYPRAGIATGISYAASSVFHYAIIAVAFLVALGFLGVTLTQVTVLAGALGVGIGFGLQGVVQNFVSGLILLFERPINVGDAVRVGDLEGWVRRIGIRASVVRTLQGAEVIIPNAQLTSEKVTNWTLTDQHRRLAIPVGVSYGTQPREVIVLLENVARAHPQVLAEPPPSGIFMGYGDSAINFELRAWTEYDGAIKVQSDLTAAIYDAVYAAGMSFPFPQREVRLLSDSPKKVADARGDAGERAE